MTSPGRRVAHARAGRVEIAALCVLTLAALLLRFTGIGFLLPSLPEPDGGVLVYQLGRFEGAATSEKREFYGEYYPTLVSHVAALWPREDCELAAGERTPLARALACAADPYMRVRKTVALLAALAVPATFMLARRFLSPGWSLAAAALLAGSLLHVWFAQESRPHGAATTLFTFSILASLELRRRPDLRAFVIAGVALALAVGVLQNGLALLVPFLAAVALREPGPRRASLFWLVPLLAGVALFAHALYPETAEGPGVPGVFLGWDPEWNAIVLNGHRIFLSDFGFVGAAVVARTFGAYEPVLSLLVVAGLVLALVLAVRRRLAPGDATRRDLLVVLAFAVPYLAVISVYGSTYQRFVIPLLPCACVLAAWALSRAAAALRARLRPRAAAAACAVLVAVSLGAQAAPAVRLAAVRAAPDTYRRAADWLAEHARPERDRVAVLPPLVVPLASDPASLKRTTEALYTPPYPWLDWQRRTPPESRPEPQWSLDWLPLLGAEERDRIAADASAFVAGLDCRYAVVHVFDMTRYHPVFRALREALGKRGRMVVRFSPDRVDQGHERPFEYQDSERGAQIFWAERVLQARSTGAVIEIYELPAAQGQR